MKRTIKAVLVGFGLSGLLTLSAAGAGNAGGEVDLSPASWPPGELEKYTELNLNYDRPHPRGVGRHGLVVGTGANMMIVLRGGRPVAATSCIGSDLFGATIQGLVNVLEYGFDPKLAQHVPYFRPPDMSDPLHPTLVTRGDFSPSLLDEVRAMGVPIVEQEPGEETRYGHWIGAIIEPSGRRMGATTNAFSGHAEGY